MSTRFIENVAWDAVVRRDATQDGRFVYGVITTGIYCRPSCPARRPRRENARWFPAPRAARAAGFRACKRCRPDAAGALAFAPAVEAALDHLETHAAENVTLARLATVVGLSPSHIRREFSREVGLSPKEYLDLLRLSRFRGQVRAGAGVARAGAASGFGSSRALYAAARKGLGMTPAQFARGGAGRGIRYVIEESSLGKVLVARTDVGVCAVLLGNDDEALERELRETFSLGALHRAAADDLDRAVVSEVDGNPTTLAVPVDHSGTPFQVRVWEALRRIPAGERRTYADVAAELGSPRAVRAVGSACARNTLAVLVPCHRVVRSDGTLAGYRWGVERKAALLAREEVTTSPAARRAP